MKHILIVDDDIHISNMLYEVLTKEGYLASRAYSGSEAALFLAAQTPDLILLDLMLPGISGEELLQKINVPVIVVSAKTDMQNKVNLLLNGAADYITKPFDINELLARIIAAMRKSNAAESQILSFEQLRLNTKTHEVYINDTEIRLTRTEYAILKLLMQNSTQVVTKSVMLERIIDDTPDCTESSLKMHISNLRKKLRDVSENDYIEAVWGIGFKLCGKNI